LLAMCRTTALRRRASAAPVALLPRAAAALIATLAGAGALSCPPADAGRLLVKFRPDVSAAAARHALAAVGAHQMRTIPDIGVRVVSVRQGGARHALTALKGSRGVAFAEPDSVARPQEIAPDNPYFPAGSAVSLDGGAWGWHQTHTTQAWDLTQGSSSVIIAVLDSGLKPQGLNFGGQILSGWNVLTGTTDTTTNAGNHGTYVAGVAVGLADDLTGNAGYCPRCMIMPVQVGTDSGFLYSNLASGIDWAADHGAQIINMSLAGTSSSATLDSAVSYAQSKGVVLFAAAGNSNCDCQTYPADTPGVLGVAGVAPSGAKAGDSNYGSWVALAAPEGDMTSWPSLDGAPGYAQVGGTSMASPAAAAIAGLVLSEDPALTGAQLAQALESSAAPASFQVA
jgi:thermitase